MKELILSAVLPLAVQPSEGETPLDSWLCDVLRAQTPETRLHDFPDEGASKAHLARRRDGEIEEWAIESTHYRVRLRYRQPGGSALRTGFELSIASVADEGPFLFDSPQEAERWLGRLGERVEERPAGALRYSDIREGTIHPHFRVVIDVKERSFEIFWEQKWLVDHPSPLYRRFGPDYRERLCPERQADPLRRDEASSTGVRR